jgi:hypothetical protein
MALKGEVTIAGKTNQTAFGLAERRAFERVTGLELWPGMSVDTADVQIALLWAAIRNSPEAKKLFGKTADEVAQRTAVENLLQAHIDDGGSMATVMRPIVLLVFDSRVVPFKADFLAKYKAKLAEGAADASETGEGTPGGVITPE